MLTISALSTAEIPLHVVHMSSRLSAFVPFRSRDRIGRRGSLYQSLHQRQDTPLSQRSAEHTLNILALSMCARLLTFELTVQRDGIFIEVRIQYFVEPMLYCVSADFVLSVGSRRDRHCPKYMSHRLEPGVLILEPAAANADTLQ